MADGQTAADIAAKLEAAFAPQRLEVVDDSAKHAGHSGARPQGETHFTVHLTSAVFTGLGRVERQRRVHAALADELAPDRVHALALSLHAPGEPDAPGSLDPA